MNGVLHFKKTDFRSAPIQNDPISGDYYTEQYMIRHTMPLALAELLDEWWFSQQLNPPNQRGFNNHYIIKVSDWLEQLREDQREQVKCYDLNDLKPVKYVSRIRREFLVTHYRNWMPTKEHPITNDKQFNESNLILRDAEFVYSGDTNQIWFSLDNYFRNVAYKTNDPDCHPTIADWYNQLPFQEKANVIRTPR